MPENMSTNLNIQKFYETLGRILGDRYGVKIKLVSIQKVSEKDEDRQRVLLNASA